ASTVPTPADASALHHASAAPVEPIDDATQKPLPPRPAWPDRLAPQLEAAARRRAAFAPAPVLGDQLDRSA
ncbi:MAG TPA: hypothetical protein VIM34_09260, partial [Burkholderiaceae bacterium]